MRSEVLRISMSEEAWGFFESLRDRVRREHRDVDVPADDRGTRMVLRAWLEGAIRDETPP